MYAFNPEAAELVYELEQLLRIARMELYRQDYDLLRPEFSNMPEVVGLDGWGN